MFPKYHNDIAPDETSRQKKCASAFVSPQIPRSSILTWQLLHKQVRKMQISFTKFSHHFILEDKDVKRGALSGTSHLQFFRRGDE
jgi:hypothetical protein